MNSLRIRTASRELMSRWGQDFNLPPRTLPPRKGGK
jgi:hypothetical protein